MIVKNESHIIHETLENLIKHIKLDYYVISDTGSTDNTIDVIKTFFNKNNISGEIYQDEWKDFGHNRTKALEYAYNKSDYLLIFDADDLIHGTLPIPDDFNADAYDLIFEGGYQRKCLVSNRIRWKYVGILHEFICNIDPLKTNVFLHGDYYIESRRLGDRNKNPNKYLDDAIILENAYNNESDAGLKTRYLFYCAQSYESNKIEKSIEYYKLYLESDGNNSHKYVVCSRLSNIFKKLENFEEMIFYCNKSIKYDVTRVDALINELECYFDNGIHHKLNMIFKYFIDKDILKDNNNKLFINHSHLDRFFYYNSISSYYVGDLDSGYNCCKYLLENNKYVDITISNLIFYKNNFILDNDKDKLIKFFLEFINNKNNSFQIKERIYTDYLSDESIFERYNIKSYASLFDQNNITKLNDIPNKNILIYTGYMYFSWNDTTLNNQSIGGAEKAVIYLSRNLPKDYNIFIAGDHIEEVKENITYIAHNNLQDFLNTNEFDSIIISRYVSFFKQFNNIKCNKLFLSAHDSTGFINNHIKEITIDNILNIYDKYIDHVICLTNWHANNIIENHAYFKNKIKIINNGINISDFKWNCREKIKNKFIWSSCAYRGLHLILNLWDKVLEKIPDATLDICSYETFPKNSEETEMKQIIDKHESIVHHGKLDTNALYDLASKCEYWLYTNTFPETSCITAMEMLMSEVVCLYYPLAGLNDTIGEYGIPVKQGEEIETILNLSTEKKALMREKGKEYALRCSWENRAQEWNKILKSDISNLDNIFIINLEKRKERKEKMVEQLEKEDIFNYKFFNAVNGYKLTESEELRNLFEGNDFNYRKGVIGCTLSHMKLWKQLINDKNNDFYIIFEDDLTLLPNFKENLYDAINTLVTNKLDYLIIAERGNKYGPDIQNKSNKYFLNNHNFDYVSFAYIISKHACAKIIEFNNKCSIKCSIDNRNTYGNVIDIYNNHKYLAFVQEEVSDIQHNIISFKFDNKIINDEKIITYSFEDWWTEEYCGGNFDFYNNFFTNLLKYKINDKKLKYVKSNENPDILFYSIFGNNHRNLKASRKIFYSGEPFPKREDADYNITFDKTDINNTRIPLWVMYTDDYLMRKRKYGIEVPIKNKFCSFISGGEHKNNYRSTFVSKLSKYKRVDCGGPFLNNLDFIVPKGINCSGKIEHNNNYKFGIAFENEDYPGYVTEKICDLYKSNCIPIYWGTNKVIEDFNPTTFINANDFDNFDKLIEYVIEVDNNSDLYNSYFKESIFSNKWLNVFNDPNNLFYKNIVDNILGTETNLFDKFIKTIDKKIYINFFNVTNYLPFTLYFNSLEFIFKQNPNTFDYKYINDISNINNYDSNSSVYLILYVNYVDKIKYYKFNNNIKIIFICADYILNLEEKNEVLEYCKNNSNVYWWDYSYNNYKYFIDNSIPIYKNYFYIPLSYSNYLEDLYKSHTNKLLFKDKPIDILFIGTTNSIRRQELLSSINNNNKYNFVILRDNYNLKEIINYIEKSKIVINIYNFENHKIFDYYRLALMYSNKTLVLNETPYHSNDDTNLENYENNTIHFSYNSIIENIPKYLNLNQIEYEELINKSYNFFKKNQMIDYVNNFFNKLN